MAHSLDRLQVGTEARVVEVAGEAQYRRRLMELGLIPGATVTLVRVAPLGDPLEISLRGSRLSLRKAEAACVQVEPLSLEPAPSPLEQEAAPGGEVQTRRVVIAGNPNTGKTTLFNALTGARGKVGNYPGITVDRLVGPLELNSDLRVELVDVPGTYSLYGRSRDEQVAIDELLGRAGAPAPDAVIVTLEASTIERGLYLLLQVQELALPTLVVVAMLEEAQSQGVQIDLEQLSAHLDLPVVGVSERTEESVAEVKAALSALLRQPPDLQAWQWHWQPSGDLATHLDQLGPAVAPLLGEAPPDARQRAVALWALMSVADDDELADIPDGLRREVARIRGEMEAEGHDLDLEVIRARYAHIDQDSPGYRQGPRVKTRSLSDRIDGVLTHPVLGLGVFLLVMAVIFGAIFDLAAPLMDGIDAGFGWLGETLRGVLPQGLLADLLVDGVLAGVGGVVIFLPQILLLFFFVTLLEGSGYMARAAFVVDRLMNRLGLHGKAFVPMLSGFACAVPAIMATRTIENRRDRLLTIMVLPLISCPARLPVYTLLIAALFPAEESLFGPVSVGMALLFSLYLLSTLLSVIAAAVLRRTLLKGDPPPLLLELPPYRLPSPRHLGEVLWARAKVFLKTAGTVIVVASVVLWAMLSFPRDVQHSRDFEAAIAAARSAGASAAAVQSLEDQKQAEALRHSLAGRLGQVIEPVLEPLGFDWKIGIGLIGSVAAREVFVATLGLVYGVGEADEQSGSLRQALSRQRWPDGRPVFTPLTGVALMVFFMIALQCLSTIAVVRQETGSWRWTLFQFGYLTALAYLATLAVYQTGRALGYS